MAKNNPYLYLFLLVFIFGVCLGHSGVYAFGAGNIPSFAYLEGKAFRHGDIEDTLAELAKKGGSGFALASLMGGRKFGGLDIKRVYFGNWLRDYSQAVDVAALKKLPLQTILNLCMALGFLAHGYATNEFEVTPERLGCYLPTEHIDNPKGYGAGEDARQYHPGLRGPVDPRELDIDPRTGMKNYIANEQGGWDTSKALVQRTLERCIQHGRAYRQNGQKADLYESFRLLGTALHTLEDYSAHSNFCEIALVSMGHEQVFTQVGDQVRIQAPNGKWVAPIVTGTFGGSDFMHSLLGEAGDKLSESSVSDLNKKIDSARSRSGPGGSATGSTDGLRALFKLLPDGMGGDMSRDMDNVQRIRDAPSQGGKRPEDMSPQELHATLWQILSFRDSVVKKIEKTIEKIPGLGALIEKIMDGISVFIFTTLEPFLKPVLKSATAGLSSASAEVIDSHDQYEVFNDPRASDPTHSFLSKDHFNLLLNEPAGRIAKVILVHSVGLVTQAWDKPSMNVRDATEPILECLFHPDFMNRNSKVQNDMLGVVHTWFNEFPRERQQSVINRLTKQSVRENKNKRSEGEGGVAEVQGSYAHQQGLGAQNAIQGYISNIPGVSQAQNLFGGGAGQRRDDINTPGFPSGPSGGSSGYGGSAAPPPVPPKTGEAASFYGGGGGGGSGYPGQGHSHHHQHHGSSSYAPPSGPPGGYGAPPSSPPPGGYGSPYGGGPPAHGGYNPSYSSPPPSFPGSGPSYGGGPPSFPGSAPPFPGGDSGPGFPDANAYAPPSGFPDANAYAPPGFPAPQNYGGGGGGPPGFPHAQHPPYGGGGGW
ncbi:Het-C-domain-containing protein [Cylindrobasidium torrendii FP15055 ss-10]|uniref:Het-C-domain-containing protein n=1 Tax=Cylindrobasidium torrendii FP15055 ss-10 TaxID=1314674 RepID=A0A0D7BGI6_9AGAR|nr:Het-C-domain-containing protein [Cylindrobasidium torrendii FP15055 ss-10]